MSHHGSTVAPASSGPQRLAQRDSCWPALLTPLNPQSKLPIMAPLEGPPPILAEPYVGGQRLRTFAMIIAGCALTLAVSARLQDIPNIGSEDSAAADIAIVIVITLALMAVLKLLIVGHNGADLRTISRAAWRNQAALRLSEQMRAEHAGELAALRARLITVADTERRRLERDLHDGAQQHLVALAVLIQLARTSQGSRSDSLLVEASALLKTAIDEIRRIAHGIYPPLLVAGGLAQALPAAAKHAALPVRVSVQDLPRYPAPIEAALYYCCTEALQNAAKHGGPGTTATITARGDDDVITLTVSDTGCGFDTATTGTGLTNMRDRLEAIGGTLVIDAGPGHGTRIIASVAATAPVTLEPAVDQAFQLAGC
jgi:signal transduction histidine kinase